MLAHWPLTKAGQLKAAHACLRAQCSGGKEGAPRTALLRLSGGKERRERERERAQINLLSGARGERGEDGRCGGSDGRDGPLASRADDEDGGDDGAR